MCVFAMTAAQMFRSVCWVFALPARGSAALCPPSSTEIHSGVVFRQPGKAEVGVRTAVPAEAEGLLHVVLWIEELQVQISQVLQSPPAVLFVPEDVIKVCDAV